MSLNGINNVGSNYQNNKVDTKANKATKEKANTSSKAEDKAAVYEPSKRNSSATKKIYKQDTATVNQMKSEAENRNNQLQDLVTKLLTKQGTKVDAATNIFNLLREGKVNVDPATAAQAKADIAADGYWGVEQTSDRMFSFAKALTGGDPEKADLMINAFKKGYAQATKAWGGELPSICKDTYDATIKKFDEWKSSTNSSMESQTSNELQNQAATEGISK